MFALATRRGKQFNTMVHETSDAITGAAARDAVFMHEGDAKALGLRNGDPVVLCNQVGELHGRVFFARIQPRNLQVYWPEGNVLIDHRQRSPHVPDYNAFVTIEPVAVAHAAD